MLQFDPELVIKLLTYRVFSFDQILPSVSDSARVSMLC